MKKHVCGFPLFSGDCGCFFDFSNKIANMSEKTETKLYDGH